MHIPKGKENTVLLYQGATLNVVKYINASLLRWFSPIVVQLAKLNAYVINERLCVTADFRYMDSRCYIPV